MSTKRIDHYCSVHDVTMSKFCTLLGPCVFFLFCLLACMLIFLMAYLGIDVIERSTCKKEKPINVNINFILRTYFFYYLTFLCFTSSVPER